MSATEAVPIDARSDEAAAERARAGGTPSRGADRFAMVAVVFTGAIFGFFYAWVCSTMWGLDDADPRVAIDAMQAMNASVRNAVFFPAFFLTPVVLGAAAVLLHRTERTEAGRWFVAAALVYLLGGLVLTMVVNVPMRSPGRRCRASACTTSATLTPRFC